jgi:pantothenate kinase
MFAFHQLQCRVPVAGREPPGAARAAARIAQRVLSDPRCSPAQRRYVVGLAAIPGAGKSTVANILQCLLQQSQPRAAPSAVALIGMDGWHYTRAQLDSFPDPALAHARRGAPWTFDVPAFTDALAAFKSCEERTLALPSFDHSAKDPKAGAIKITPATRLLVVEGNYLGLDDGRGGAAWSTVRRLIDLLVFLEVDVDVAMERVHLRHISELGLSPAQSRRRVAENDRPNAELIAASAASADVTIVCDDGGTVEAS